MLTGEPAWATPFNVVALFVRREQAQQARDLLVDEGIPANSAADRATLRAEMQDEINESWAAPVFFIPGPQARAASWATLSPSPER